MISELRSILYEIEETQNELDEGAKAWAEGANECIMASCDPSDQYLLEEKIASLVNDFKRKASTL